jgi:hypothetical protein
MNDDPQSTAASAQAFGQASQPASTVEHPLILASRVEGAAVYNEAGERIGHVSDISLEKVSGRAIYGIVSFGGFLCIGTRFHPVPWSMLTFDPGQGGFVVKLNKAELEAAPHYESQELEKLGGAHRVFDESIYAYYARFGVPPYL